MKYSDDKSRNMPANDILEAVLNRLPAFRGAREERNRIKTVYLESIHQLNRPTTKLRTKTVAFPTSPHFKLHHLGDDLQKKQTRYKTKVSKVSYPRPFVSDFMERWYENDDAVVYYPIESREEEIEEVIETMFQELIEDIERKNRRSRYQEVALYMAIALIISGVFHIIYMS